MPDTLYAPPYRYILLEDGSAEITGFSGNDRVLRVPAALQGHPVTALGERAFEDIDFLTRVRLPEGRVRVGPKGTAFVLRDRETGEEAACQTRLLGEHAISNILLSAVVARKLGMTLEEIARGISQSMACSSCST